MLRLRKRHWLLLISTLLGAVGGLFAAAVTNQPIWMYPLVSVGTGLLALVYGRLNWLYAKWQREEEKGDRI
jgi:nitrate/nitrite transporter NarK